MYVQSVALWTASPEGGAPPAELLPARARGRASLLTRMISEVVAVSARNAQCELASTALIVGSAYGEMETTMQLLAMMREGDGQLSPARFQASVHNAGAGQLSIATGSRGFSTCLGAGRATAAAVLTEAYALLACRGGEVIAVVADEALPPFFAGEEQQTPAAVGIALTHELRKGALAVLGAPHRSEEPAAVHALAPSAVAPFAALADAIVARSFGTLVLPGLLGGWAFELSAAEAVP